MLYSIALLRARDNHRKLDRDRQNLDPACIKAADIYEQMQHTGVVSITFSAMCLEAFFYDYAATELDASSAKGLDDLSLPEKLLVTPKLVTGKAIQRGENLFQRIT